MSNTHESSLPDAELEAFIRQRCTVVGSCLQYTGPAKVNLRGRLVHTVQAYRELLGISASPGERLAKECDTPGCIDPDCWRAVLQPKESKSQQNAHNNRVAVEAAIRRLEQDSEAIQACLDKLKSLIDTHEQKRIVLLDKLAELSIGVANG